MILLLRFLILSAVTTVGGVLLVGMVLSMDGIGTLLFLPLPVACAAADFARTRRRRTGRGPGGFGTALVLAAAYAAMLAATGWLLTEDVSRFPSTETREMQIGLAVFLGFCLLALAVAARIGFGIGGGTSGAADCAARPTARMASSRELVGQGAGAVPGLGAMVARFLLAAVAVVLAGSAIRYATGYGNLFTSLIAPAMAGAVLVADFFYKRTGVPLAGAMAWAVTLVASVLYGALQTVFGYAALATGQLPADALPVEMEGPLVLNILAIAVAVLLVVVIVTVRSFIAIGGQAARNAALRRGAAVPG